MRGFSKYLICMGLVACSEQNFSGGAPSPKPAKPSASPENPGEVTGSSVEQVPETPRSDDLKVEGDIPEKCYFAVSGGYFGYSGSMNSYSSTFPKTSSGNPIAHGERFDSVGGVYLNARPEPFIYQQGGREIDGAVLATFDSIAVAPGMSVEIRAGGEAGAVIYQGNGPYMALSSDYAENLSGAVPFLLGQFRPRGMPNWMKTHLESLTVLPRIPLHNGKWVKVSKLPGVPCE